MKLITHYKIRFSDCDSFKHLHNSDYIDYMLNAREDHLKEFHNISITELYTKGSGWMVNKNEIVYLNPAVYNEQVCIESNLIKCTEDSLLVEMSMWDKTQHQLKALLWTKFIHFDTYTNKRAKHPDWFMNIAATLENKELQHLTDMGERLTIIRSKSIKNEL